MGDRDTDDRIAALDARIARVRDKHAPKPPVQDHHSMAQLGWRMVIELVTGLLVGAAIGYGADWVLGTMSLFLVVFTLLGFAAGVRTMLRSAEEFQGMTDQPAPPRAGAQQEDDSGGGR